MSQRLGLAGIKQAARMSGVRHQMHAGASPRRDDGFQRGRVRGLLPVSSAVAPEMKFEGIPNIEIRIARRPACLALSVSELVGHLSSVIRHLPS